MKQTSLHILTAALLTTAVAAVSAAPCVGSRPLGLGTGSPDVTFGAGNSSISSIGCTFVESTTPSSFLLGINVIYNGVGLGSMAIDGLLLNRSYTVTMTVTNLSGSTFSSMATELLDRAGDPNDLLDGPTPSWVPVGWSTSNNDDLLSFAQAANPPIPRTSSIFQTVVADELAERDFLDFVNGDFLSGTTQTLSFGLLVGTTGLQPFLLTQRPNQRSITQPDPNPMPEPATLMLAGIGLLGIGALRRRNRS